MCSSSMLNNLVIMCSEKEVILQYADLTTISQQYAYVMAFYYARMNVFIKCVSWRAKITPIHAYFRLVILLWIIDTQ